MGKCNFKMIARNVLTYRPAAEKKTRAAMGVQVRSPRRRERKVACTRQRLRVTLYLGLIYIQMCVDSFS